MNPQVGTAPIADLPNGEIRDIDGISSIHFEGYWIRYYEPPPETVENKRNLVFQLAKRVFHHTELGINTPGRRLEMARLAYDKESDAERKRVNAAMLAGALINRGCDIFTVVFEMQQKGISIASDNELMLEVESCFLEALELGKQVKHYSGEEGLDELWGEPFKAFSMSIGEFYTTRYLKIAQTMASIDRIAEAIAETYCIPDRDDRLVAMLYDYSAAAKQVCETWKTDGAFFEVWPRFVADGRYIRAYIDDEQKNMMGRAVRERIQKGADIIKYIAFARVPMPVTTSDYLDDCKKSRLS